MENKKLKQLKTAQSRRRGVAIEMAMLFLLVVVALSILLVSVSMLQIGKMGRADERLEQRAVLDRIGEGFCLLQERYNLPPEYAQEYDAAVSGSGSTLTLHVYPHSTGETPKPVLTVELTDNNDGTYTVTKWSYGE